MLPFSPMSSNLCVRSWAAARAYYEPSSPQSRPRVMLILNQASYTPIAASCASISRSALIFNIFCGCVCVVQTFHFIRPCANMRPMSQPYHTRKVRWPMWPKINIDMSSATRKSNIQQTEYHDHEVRTEMKWPDLSAVPIIQTGLCVWSYRLFHSLTQLISTSRFWTAFNVRPNKVSRMNIRVARSPRFFSRSSKPVSMFYPMRFSK